MERRRNIENQREAEGIYPANRSGWRTDRKKNLPGRRTRHVKAGEGKEKR